MSVRRIARELSGPLPLRPFTSEGEKTNGKRIGSDPAQGPSLLSP